MPNLTVIPVPAPIQQDVFDLVATVVDSLDSAGQALEDGDVLAISSKYAAISVGRVVKLDDIQIDVEAANIAERYVMNPKLTALVLQEADHVFGGIVADFNDIDMGFLLTAKDGIISPNAGLDRSNIPNGQVVLFPKYPYRMAADIHWKIKECFNVDIGVILTDSWLMPGRTGTTGVALATAGFKPVEDERGKLDLFGNPMQVTQRGVADSISVCAQMVMGETDEAIPIAIVRNTGIELTDETITVEDVGFPWQQDIYIGSLTDGLLEDGANGVEARVKQSFGA